MFGSSAQARMILQIVEKQKNIDVVGLIDNSSVGDKIHGCPVLGSEDILDQIIDRFRVNGVAIGIGDNFARSSIATMIGERFPELCFVNVIDQSAQIAHDVQLGVGNVIMPGTVINAGSTIGDHCIVNTSASLDHDNRLGDFASVGPGACCGGNVQIGKFSALGLGCSVIHNIRIGRHSVVGAGAVVIRNVGDEVVCFGVPAKVFRKRRREEPYL